jgi:hypothetical protein
LPTTTPRSERGERRARYRAALLSALLLLAACAAPTKPEELLQLSPESSAHRAMETRMFETPNETELLSASAAVLQDLGFQVSESAREVGFLRAAKERSAREYGQEITRVLVALLSTAASVLGGGNAFTLTPVDLQQQINASLVTRPLDDAGTRYEVRVLFYRLVWKGSGQSGNAYVEPGQQRMEMIRDAGIYQQFFARLSKSVFLEAQRI